MKKKSDDHNPFGKTNDKIKESLRNSMKDGVAASIMTGTGDTYINPYAISLNASNTQISLLSSFPNLVSSLFQIKAPKLMGKFRKRNYMVNLFVFIHSLMWIPIILTPFLFPKNLAVWFLILFFTLSVTFNGLAGPAWASMMTDLVKENNRAKFFGHRNRVNGFVNLIATLVAGYLLNIFSDHSKIVYGFVFIFSFALLSRLVSWHYLSRMYEPNYKNNKINFRFKDFLNKINSPFGKFVLFYFLITLGANIAGPFFSLYMLRDLNFSYLTYTILVVFAALGNIIGMSFWGKHIDEYGSVKALKANGIFVAILPWLWLFSPSPYYLIFVQLLGGFSWAGFGLAGFNYIFSATLDKKAYYVAYFNAFAGAGAFIGASIGGFLTTYFFSNLLILFFISGLFRIVSCFFMFNRLKEVNVYKEKGSVDLFLEITGIGNVFEMIGLKR